MNHLNNNITNKIEKRNNELIKIHNNLQDIKDIQKDLGYNIINQQDSINTINNNIYETNENLEEITNNLEETISYSRTPIMTTITGILIGGAFGGPVGSIAGLKLAAAIGLGTGTAALGGGIGYYSQIN